MLHVAKTLDLTTHHNPQTHKYTYTHTHTHTHRSSSLGVLRALSAAHSLKRARDSNCHPAAVRGSAVRAPFSTRAPAVCPTPPPPGFYKDMDTAGARVSVRHDFAQHLWGVRDAPLVLKGQCLYDTLHLQQPVRAAFVLLLCVFCQKRKQRLQIAHVFAPWYLLNLYAG